MIYIIANDIATINDGCASPKHSNPGATASKNPCSSFALIAPRWRACARL